MPQLHKRLSDEPIKAILIKYTNKELSAKEAIQYLDVGRTRFYELVRSYHDDPNGFTIAYR